MIIAALLPPPSVDCLRRLGMRHELRFAASWQELGRMVDQGAELVVMDPTVNGTCNVCEAAKVLRQHSAASSIAYVAPTPQNLKAVFHLSKCGLYYVFVHKAAKPDAGLLSAIENAASRRMAFDLLGNIEDKLAGLHPRAKAALDDLFTRPYRYDAAADLAREAEIPLKQLYKEFSHSELRTPKEMIVLAKAIYGYVYLRFARIPVRVVSKKLACVDVRMLSRHVASVFGCSIGELRAGLSSEEYLLRLIEWMYKPSVLRRRLGKHLLRSM